MSRKRDNSIIEANLDSEQVAFEEIESGSAEGQDGVISVLVYWIGASGMAINVEQTEGVVDCPRVTPLPNAPDSILGVASVRGRMTLVMDLRMGNEPGAAKQRLILIKGDRQIGLLADRVEGVVSLRRISQKSNSSNRMSALSNKDRSQTLQIPSICFFRRKGLELPLIDTDHLAENA